MLFFIFQKTRGIKILAAAVKSSKEAYDSLQKSFHDIYAQHKGVQKALKESQAKEAEANDKVARLEV